MDKEKWEEEFDEIQEKTNYNDYTPKRFCCGGDYCDGGHLDFIKSFIKSTIQKDREEIVEKIEKFLKEELGYKGKYIEIDTSKKSHGACCYCPECGHDNDNCVCENNRIYEFITNLNQR